MFTWSVRVGCKFPACQGESVKFQTCFIFLRLLPTLVSDPNFSPLANSLSVTLSGLLVNQTGLSVTNIQLVPNMDFQTERDDSPTMREVLQYSR